MISARKLKELVDQVLRDTVVLDVHEANGFANICNLFRCLQAVLIIVAEYVANVNMGDLFKSFDGLVALQNFSFVVMGPVTKEAFILRLMLSHYCRGSRHFCCCGCGRRPEGLAMLIFSN